MSFLTRFNSTGSKSFPVVQKITCFYWNVAYFYCKYLTHTIYTSEGRKEVVKGDMKQRENNVSNSKESKKRGRRNKAECLENGQDLADFRLCKYVSVERMHKQWNKEENEDSRTRVLLNTWIWKYLTGSVVFWILMIKEI